MTDTAADFIAILFGIGVFLVIVAVGWRSVQRRRILRLQGAHGQETIIVAREGDELSTVVTTSEPPQPAPAPSVVVVNPGGADAETAPEFGRKAAKPPTAI